MATQPTVGAMESRSAQGGESFRKVAREVTDDPDFIRENEGLIPLWLTADAPGYQDTWAQADKLNFKIEAPYTVTKSVQDVRYARI